MPASFITPVLMICVQARNVLSLNLIDSLPALSVYHIVCTGPMAGSVTVYADLTDDSASSVLGNCGRTGPKTPECGETDHADDENPTEEFQEGDSDGADSTGLPTGETSASDGATSTELPAREAPASGAGTLVQMPVAAGPKNEDCATYPPITRAGKGGRAHGFRRCPADVGAQFFYGKSWARSIKQRDVPAHWYFIDARGFILTTSRNTCLEYNKTSCTRHDCLRYHTALGNLMNVLPRSTVKPVVMAKVTGAQASERDLFVGGISLLAWPVEELAKIDARKKLDRRALQDEMQHLEAQEAERTEERTFTAKLDRMRRQADLARHAEAQAAIGATDLPSQLLLGYAEPPPVGAGVPADGLQDELDAAELRAELLVAKLAAAEAKIALRKSRGV